MEQRERDEVLLRFAHKSCSVLVATDIAARGLDIKGLSAVISWELPVDPDVHLHRIGRTGRAGRRVSRSACARPASAIGWPRSKIAWGRRCAGARQVARPACRDSGRRPWSPSDRTRKTGQAAGGRPAGCPDRRRGPARGRRRQDRHPPDPQLRRDQEGARRRRRGKTAWRQDQGPVVPSAAPRLNAAGGLPGRDSSSSTSTSWIPGVGRDDVRRIAP